MRNFIQTKSFRNPIALLLLLLFSFSTYSVYAEGSRDLYPNGAQGYRAYLLSSTTDANFNPFSNPGRMYVYAKAGETIYVGSSMQGMSLSGTTAQIILTAPNGQTYNSGTSTTVGRIQNRTQELIGPAIGGNGGYNAYTRTVASNQEGIWEINFTSVGYGTNISSPPNNGSGIDRNYTANANWVQETHAYSASLIAAWDVSVGSSGVLIPGRAYSTVFNGTAPNNRFNERSFYSKFYVVTPEGFTYLVDNNGQNGASFNFFSNNKGVMTNFPNGGSAYESLNASDVSTVSSNVWDPRQPDSGNNITNKLFFNPPANDLPTSASIRFGSTTTTTWLRNTPVLPQINNLKLIGFEAGNDNTVGPKGSIISFSSNISGQYRILIDVNNNGSYEDDVDVAFVGTVGANEEVELHWDGRDNLGNLVHDNAEVKVRGVISVSEVHFPFIDVESNLDGFIIQQTDHTSNYAVIPGRDVVYWNDSPTSMNPNNGQVPSNPRNARNDGFSSNSNGHKWGGNGSTQGGGGPDTDFYGNNRTIDTWTFVESVPQVLNSTLTRHIGDLAVNSVTPNVSTANVCADTVVYTIEIENKSGAGLTDDAEGAKFTFAYPEGFEVWDVSYSTIVGTTSLQNGTASTSTTAYSVLVDIKNGSKGLFTIKGRVNPPLVANSNISVQASILRPADFEDIDATDANSTDTIPTNPQQECDGLPSGVGCNNIVSNNAVQTVKCPGPTFLNCLGEATCVNPENSGFKSEDPASLSYDNVISVWHSSAAQWVDGTIKVWGEYTGPVGNSSKNPSLVPTSITPGNGYNYTGEPVMIAMASMWDHPQFILLTSDDKLWAWGWKGVVVNSTLTPGGSGDSERNFRQLTIGLPTGVSASDVKMLFGTVQTLALTTCSGEVYVLSQNDLINQGGGSTDWVRVQYSNNSNGNTASGYLENIIATRGTSAGLVALDENGDLWTWGYGTRLGNNTTVANRTYAVKMTRPKAGTIKMIGAMKEMQAWSGYTAFNYTVGTGQNQRPVDMTYYVLYQDGALYALGGNRDGQIGNFSTTTTFDSWQQPRYASGGGTSNIMNNIAWISPQEHSYNEYPMINVISRNNNGEVWNWGQESGYDLGRGVQSSTGTSTKVDPGMPTQFTGGNNDVITVESGSHTTMLLKKCNNTFGYIGHKTNGSMGDGSTDDNSINRVQFESNVIDVCGLPTVDGTLKPKLANSDTYCNADLIELIGEPVGGVYSIASVDGNTSGAIYNSISIDQNGMLDARNMNWGSGSGAVTQRNVRVYYELPPSSECAGAIVQVLITVENCKEYKITIPGNIWIDENEDAVLGNNENNLENSNIWANLVNSEGEVIGQAKVNADGSYEIEVSNRNLSTSGNYQVILTKNKKAIGSNLSTGDQAPDNTYYTGTNRGTVQSANTSNTEGVVSIGNLNTYYTTNSDVTVDEVNFGVAYSKLSIKKTSDVVNGYMAGDTITYRIVVKNNDDFIHNSVKLTDTLPTGVTYVTNSTNAALGNNQIQVSVQHTDTLSGSSAGSFVVPNGVTSLTVQAWAGGGSGGSRSSGSGAYGGGGGGGMSESTFNVSQGTYYYSVGAGAAGNSTSAGDDTWFATTSGSQNNNNNVIVRAKGGSSVANNSTSGANGGTSSTSGSTGAKGDIRYAGGNGANASGNDAGGGGSSAGVSANGVNATNISGATAPTGGGNGGDGVNVNADGNPGFIPGGGGGGARRTSGTRNGGAGADGQIIISYSSTTTQIIQGNVGSPSVLANDWSILPGDSLVVTYKVVVNNPAIDSIYNKASATSNFVKTPIVDDVIDYSINPPLAKDDINQTPVNVPVDGNILTNDKGEGELVITEIGGKTPNSNGDVVITDLMGTDSSGNHVPAGKITIHEDGSYTYEPAKDFVGIVDPIPYTITDDSGLTDDAQLIIKVIPNENSNNPNNNNVVAQDDNYVTKQDTPIGNTSNPSDPSNPNILNNDNDPQGDDFKVTEAGGNTPDANGVITIPNVSGKDENGQPVSNVGTITVDEDGYLTFTPNDPNFTGTVDPILYTIEDENGATDSAYINIRIIPEDGKNGTVANDDANIGPKGKVQEGNVLDNDYDADQDPQSVTEFIVFDVNGNKDTITTGNTGDLYVKGVDPENPNDYIKVGTLKVNSDGTYTYTPTPLANDDYYVGTVAVPYSIKDNNNPKGDATDNATLYLTTIDVVNTTNAVNDENSTWVNTPVDGNVMTNDFDLEGDEQVFGSFIKQDGSGTPISGSGQGTLVNGVDANGNTVTGAGYLKFDGNGNYTFTPINDFVGTVSVPYTIKDKDNPAGVARDTAVLEITVSPMNTKENSVIANNDEYYTQGSPVESNILTNDADPQGDNFTVTEITYTDKNGSHTVNVDGTHPVNNIAVSGIDEDGNPVDVAGHLSLDENGNMVFTPENGFAGTVTYDYEITDNNGNPAKDNATVVITVVKDNNGPQNDPPFAGDDFSYTDINTPVNGSFIDNDGDLNDDPVYMTKENGTKVIIDPTITEGNKQPVRTDETEKGGTITYYDNGTYTYNPPKDYVGPDRSVYGICDSTVIQPKPLCAEATVHVLVGGKNSTNAVNDENSTWVNTPVDGNVMTNDFDKEGDVQVFESFIKQDGSGTPISGSGQGALVNGVDANGNTVAGAGYLKFDGNGNYTFTPIDSFVGTVSIPYTIKDKDNPAGVAKDTAILEITVSPKPTDANSVIANNDEYHTKGSPVTSNILINDADPQGDNFEVTKLSQNGTPISINTPTIVKGIDENGNVVNNAGTLTVDKDGNMMFVPEPNFQGQVIFDYEITDDYTTQPAKDIAQVVITVERPKVDARGPENNPPHAGDDFSYTTVNTPVNGNFVDNDSDPDDNPIYMAKENGTKVIIDPSITESNKQPIRTDETEKGGTITYYDNGTYTYSPPQDYVGPDRSVYGICDSTVIQPKPLCTEATVHTLIGEGLTIEGNVYHDANGMTDDYVNGNGVNVSGQIYAILTDTNGVVLQSVPVNANGTYEFNNAPFQTDLLIVIDTVQREKGTTVTSSTLPDGWVSTGEKLGKIDAVSGNDGNIDGKNSEVGKPRTNVVDINFGIQQPPLADPKEYYLETSDFSLTPVSGYPAITTPTGDEYYSIPTSSPSLTGVTNYVNKGLLTGSDPEDCVVCKDNATYIINEIYPTTRLYYDFGGNRGVDEVVPGDTLVNYDPNKLVIYGMKGAGQVDSLTDKPLGFQYSLVDNAGFSSPAVDYRITTDAALPIELIYFTATSEDCKVLTQWATASELNNDYFEVQRSYNAKDWETIATISGNGTTNLRHDYTYVDQGVQSGLVYYRLKQTDFDGTVATHKIVSVNVIGCDETSIRLYPNPTSSLLRVEIKGKDLLKTQFNVISTDGRLMMSIDKVETSNTIDVSRFAAGTYYLQITDRSNGQIQSLPFVIVK